MESKLEIDLSYIASFIDRKEMDATMPFLDQAHQMLKTRTGLGSEYTGWLDLPKDYDKNEIERIKAAAKKIRSSCDVFILAGIGGSYLGARAAIEMLSHNFYNELNKKKRRGPKIFYAGNNMNASYLNDLLELIKDKDICINVVSKSGKTSETAIAFHFLEEFMEKKYGKKEAAKRIFVTTDKEKGILKAEADAEGYERFTVQDDIGGRYSVLTSVGLLPIAVAGIDIDKILMGALEAYEDFKTADIWHNSAYQYAAIRNILYQKGKEIEIFAAFVPGMQMFGEWWKQLFAESEGKNGKGIFPANLNYTSDLHSVGQYIQEGRRILFETIINIENMEKDMLINNTNDSLDGLGYLEGKTVNYVEKCALKGTASAHACGGIPVVLINIPKLSPHYFGYMVYFFEFACALSAYLIGVNPFNQPGVEMYKNNMFKLLKETGDHKK